tara:strand:+ start:108 stop:287 length:180 start_codon:yes stop_codon:yes gene_type:complete
MGNNSLSDRVTEKAWLAYEEYLTLDSSDKSIDFTSFSVGFFLGLATLAKSVKKKEYGNG